MEEKTLDFHAFYTGTSLNAYEFLGAHVTKNGTVFRVYAPAASRITVTGEFNNWGETDLNRIHNGQFWECTITSAHPGMMYKYKIYTSHGCTEHCDPYGYGMEVRPNWASIIRNTRSYKFHDSAWMKKRTNHRTAPLNIYEFHAGSWRTHWSVSKAWYTYRDLAEHLLPYVKEKGYNYIELLPLAEHPSDDSWGYQCTGFYSPTARYGSMDDLKYFIDMCHKQNVGVILDFVPVHFALDSYGLANFDGTTLYEYPHGDVGNSEWGSKNFNHSRGEVQSFLASCANYWLSEYHFDGLRIDALSNIIYWHGNKERGVNTNAVEFIRTMNNGLKQLHPGIMLIAEDSTSYPGVTTPTNWGGLGFDYKWDMGWMNDTLSYFQMDTNARKQNYHKLTFSMMYYYSESFLLPLSHDEVVHGKATILQKMNGYYDEKFPQARALYLYMYAHPGKKLNFMGNEFGQLREWDEKEEQDWAILTYPIHDAFATFMKDLCKLYLKSPALSERDFEESGFHWLDCHQEDRCIYAFERTAYNERIAAVFNFSDTPQTYYLPINDCSHLKLLISSAEEKYAGTKKYNKQKIYAAKDNQVKLELPAFSGAYYKVF